MTAVRRLIDRSVRAAQQGVLLTMPHGGQRIARTNAWVEVQAGWSRRDDRVSAAQAVEASQRAVSSPARVYAAGGR